jgi:hypothetical protein
MSKHSKHNKHSKYGRRGKPRNPGNALFHGGHARTQFLPDEKREDYEALVTSTRLEFGIGENATVDEIADIRWTNRRLKGLEQLAFVEFVRGLEKFRRRSFDDSHAKAVLQLSEAFASVAEALKKKGSGGKVASNMRCAMHDVEKLLPIIEAGAKSSDPEQRIDRAFKWLQVASELAARKEGQIAKKIQNLFMSREFNRQYGQDSNLKLLPHAPPTTADTASKEIVIRSKASSKKTKDAKDNWDEDNDDNDNNDNDGNDNDGNDNEPNPNDYDWEHEYDQAMADRKKTRG